MKLIASIKRLHNNIVVNNSDESKAMTKIERFCKRYSDFVVR